MTELHNALHPRSKGPRRATPCEAWALRTSHVSQLLFWILTPPSWCIPVAAGMVERVRRLLASDTDVQVIANCLSVLMQVRRPVCTCLM